MTTEAEYAERGRRHVRVMHRVAPVALYPSDLLFMIAAATCDGLGEKLVEKTEDEQVRMCMAAQEAIRGMTAWMECFDYPLSEMINKHSRSGGTWPMRSAAGAPPLQ